MKDEYIEILASMLGMFTIVSIVLLVADLFKDGIFVLGMIMFIIVWFPVHGVAFLIQALRTNYIISKREKQNVRF